MTLIELHKIFEFDKKSLSSDEIKQKLEQLTALCKKEQAQYEAGSYHNTYYGATAGAFEICMNLLSRLEV